MEIKFLIRGKPTAQARHRDFIPKRKDGSLVLKPDRTPVRIHVDTHKQAKNDFLALAHENAPETPLRGPLLVFIKCVFPRPKKHYWTGKRADILRDDAPLFAPSHRNDFDNLGKFICDALNHIFYEDDGQIVLGTVLKVYGIVPRTEVTLRTIDEVTWRAVDADYDTERIVELAIRDFR